LVLGPEILINAFDRLMADHDFKDEFKQYLDKEKYLTLDFLEGKSRFNYHSRQIFIDDSLVGSEDKILIELAFELHNAIAILMSDSLKEKNQIPEKGKSDDQKIKNIRIKEYTEWLNLIKLGAKAESKQIDLSPEFPLPKLLGADYIDFDGYLYNQITKNHTQRYLEAANLEIVNNGSLDIKNNDSEYFRKNIPTLFQKLEYEDEMLVEVLDNLKNAPDIKEKINWGSDSKTVHIKKECKLRSDDKEKSIQQTLKAGEAVKVLDKQKEGNYFSKSKIGFGKKSHFWVQSSTMKEGWVKKEAID